MFHDALNVEAPAAAEAAATFFHSSMAFLEKNHRPRMLTAAGNPTSERCPQAFRVFVQIENSEAMTLNGTKASPRAAGTQSTGLVFENIGLFPSKTSWKEA
jgi:hypothetical protein